MVFGWFAIKCLHQNAFLSVTFLSVLFSSACWSFLSFLPPIINLKNKFVNHQNAKSSNSIQNVVTVHTTRFRDIQYSLGFAQRDSYFYITKCLTKNRVNNKDIIQKAARPHTFSYVNRAAPHVLFMIYLSSITL